MSIELIRRTKKKNKFKLSCFLKNKYRTSPYGSTESIDHNSLPVTDIIQHYISEFQNIVKARIGRAMRKYPSLRRSDIAEEMFAQFCANFTSAITTRKLQLWKANDKMINVYIQRMIENIIIDTLRRLSKHEAKRQRPSISTANFSDEENLSFVTYLKEAKCKLNTPRLVDGEYAVIVQDLFDKAVIELKGYNPKGYELLKQLLDPEADVNLSSPVVHALKREFVAILKSLT